MYWYKSEDGKKQSQSKRAQLPVCDFSVPEGSSSLRNQ